MHLPRRNISNLNHTNSSCSQQHFIPSDGIDPRVLRNYIAYNFGDNIALKPAVNAQDGKEGFIMKCSLPFSLEDVKLLQKQSQELRHAEKLHYQNQYLEKLQKGWAQHQNYLDHETQIQDINSIPTQRIDRNLPIPFLDLPPTYNDVEGLHSNKRPIQPLRQTIPEDNGVDLDQHPRPISGSDLDYFSPCGGFYPDGYSGSDNKTTGRNVPMLSGVYGSINGPQSLRGNNLDHRFSLPASIAIGSANPLQPTWAGESFDQSRFAPLGRARSTTSLRSNDYGLAHRPSRRAGAAGEELFLNTQNDSACQQQSTLVHRAPLSARPYSDGRPVWA